MLQPRKKGEKSKPFFMHILAKDKQKVCTYEFFQELRR